MRKLVIAAGLAAVVGATGYVHAEGVARRCAIAADGDFLTVHAFLARLIDQDYKVRRLETKEGCAKIDVVGRNGAEARLFVDLTPADAAKRDD